MENGWTSQFCRSNLKSAKCNGANLKSSVMSSQIKLKRFAIFLFLILIGFLTVKSCVRQYLIDRKGIITNGRVISTSYEQSGKTHGYFVYYAFDYNGFTYKGKSEARAEWAQATSMPAAIRVKFVPSNPNLNLPLDVGVNNSFWVGISIALISLSFAVYLGAKIVLSFIGGSRNKETVPRLNQ